MGIFDWLFSKKKEWEREKKIKDWKKKEEDRINRGEYGQESNKNKKKKKGSKGSDWNNSYIQGLPNQNKTSPKDNEFIGLSGKVMSEIPQNGFGKYTFMMGVTYVGNWKNGLKHGKGKETDRDGNIINDGIWENGVLISNTENSIEEIKEKSSKSSKKKVDKETQEVGKIKVKIPIQEGSEETIILTTSIDKFKEVESEIDNLRSNEEGVDYEIDDIGNSFDYILELKPEDKLVHVSLFYIEGDSISGEYINFEFYNCGFPDEIKNKYKIVFDGYGGGDIFFVDGKPINNPEIFKGWGDSSDISSQGFKLKRFDSLDFEDIIQNVDPY